ncbi:MAG: DUF3365 domain-containing protein [Halobacteriovoraceae bacterium]|nr:DUF3365 domain-containing protein [Halobacteriovoraceae bacterium]
MKVLLFFLVTSSVFASEEVALQKIKVFGKVLKKELILGMKESPVKAVEVCNIKAPQIQKEVSTNKMKIGRVSLKTRNQKNKPKKWMKDYIDQFHEKKIKSPYVTVKLGNGKTGLLKPIKTMPLCLKCHGNNVEKNLYKVIKSKYPNDEAIGYKAGEIRGFFWAEY